MSGVKLLRLSGVRGLIAQKMRESLHKTAQLSFFCDIDASALVQARADWKAVGLKVGYEDLVIRALADILPDFPLFNAIETAAGVEQHPAIHVACAIALPGMLLAPAIFDVAALSVDQIARAREDLVTRAKLNKLTVQEMTGGTITVSNLGLTRVRHFTPIINHPQQAIIGLGQIAPRPWVKADATSLVVAPVVAPVMGLSLTVDHRVIDGAPAGEFLSALADALEHRVARPAGAAAEPAPERGMTERGMTESGMTERGMAERGTAERGMTTSAGSAEAGDQEPARLARLVHANRQTVLDFFSAAQQGHDIMALLTEDIIWWVPDHWALGGTYTRPQILPMLSAAFDLFAQPLRFTINHLTAEGDRVAVDCDGAALFRDGTPFNNSYHFLFRLHHGKIAEIKEFMNTAYVSKAFAGRLQGMDA
jgi:pyruvate dehydrogenase E2 component (dihydrolipoamide acetyltransferase)